MPADDTLVDQPEILFAMASDHVALVTLNRPEKRNAVSARLAALMAEAVGRVEADPEIRVAVLAAKGRVFCSGADLIEAARGVRHPGGGRRGRLRRPGPRQADQAMDRRRRWAGAGRRDGAGARL